MEKMCKKVHFFTKNDAISKIICNFAAVFTKDE